MLENLKQKFPNAITNKMDTDEISEYVWFEDSRSILGIPRSEITAEEISLLELLFAPCINPNNPNTYQDVSWKTFLSEPNAPLPLTSWENVRFIHFKLTHADFSNSDFEDAFLAFVPSDAALVWENETSGILIETDKDGPLSNKELIAISSTLESDFYVKTRMFTGRFHPVNQDLHHHRNQEKKCFYLAQVHLPDLKVADLADIIPHSLINDLSVTNAKWYINEILGKTKQDTELIKTIKTYIECNSNATYAAKQLYIHRNSLQYRIDRFSERTGLDIRNFRHALTAYLILLLND
ncbi:helix-turn-helix domain-containing protein [Peribacillus sp. ACCC06369]|uniref:PucR family transcriptional regulator n=1 Tax=Peribacillus sp. ACCC06369 TaxID=3055860 RepID=UPI0025A2C70C|nr:helix-turn-helix domain-containing protein [Peribacillus sp. ACCC06369]MDM5357506.1 helix-turn-helix domain-containing protein [Peribacillus sp. ACCC06369]